MHMKSSCPALFISAPASGQGKTTLTAAIARHHYNQGRRVRVFKTGPDFLDPMILQHASGHPVYQLDLWMTGEAESRRRLHLAAREADLILVEGVMGLFDGKPSAADLAATFGLPVAIVIDASAMAQTFGAIAHGLARYRGDLTIAGVIANRIASPGHADLLREGLPDGLAWLGTLPRDDELELPERHLGLVQAHEINGLERRLDAAATAIAGTPLAEPPPAVSFARQPERRLLRLLDGVCIGVARDDAFGFIYPANIDLLERLGAHIEYFSPLLDNTLPDVDALWLPGGYPELHLPALQENAGMRQAITEHHAADRPILAECGGMLYLLSTLRDTDGEQGRMLGLLPGQASLQNRLAGLGMQAARLPEGEMRGHSFHHSRLDTPLQPLCRARDQRTGQPGEPIFRLGRLTASYLHFYFPSNPAACAALFTP